MHAIGRSFELFPNQAFQRSHFKEKIVKIVSFVFAVLALFASHAALADEEGIKKLLGARFPEIKVEKITKSGYEGLYEIFAGGEIFYTDEKAAFVLVGHLIDAKTREDATELRLRKLTAVPFDQLPLDNAIKTVRGNGARRIAVFADPYCGFCKRFENDLITLQDITIYTFLLPIIRQESVPTSKKIWCSDDRTKAWQDLMLKGIEPSGEGNCEAPLNKNIALGQKLHITGTPLTVFEDGERIPGAIPKVKLEQKMASAVAVKTAVDTAKH